MSNQHPEDSTPFTYDNCIAFKINVEIYPEINLAPELNQITPLLNNPKIETIREVTILLDRTGSPVYPQNLFLHSLFVSEDRESNESYATALLAYTRWLDLHDFKYNDIKKVPRHGAPWQFAEYLKSQLKEIDRENGCIKNPEGYALSTCKFYVSVVVMFYKWLHEEGILLFERKAKAFNFKKKSIRKHQNKNHDILSHIRIHDDDIEILTSDVMKIFPNVQSVEPHRKLKPIQKKDKEILYSYLDECSGCFPLMVKLAIETGLRLEEVVTFPDANIESPMTDFTKYIVSPVNGVKTKFKKERTIEIPAQLLTELYEFKTSDERQRMLKNAGLTIDNNNLEQESISEYRARTLKEAFSTKEKNEFKKGFDKIKGDEKPHGRLFVNQSGVPFAKKTIDNYWMDLRKKIRLTHPDWYYKFHDTRSTFATYYLERKQKEYNRLYDDLLSELSELMGHESTVTTVKYIKFMNEKVIRINHSGRKNEQAAKTLDGRG